MKFIRCMIILAVLSAVFSVTAEGAWTYDVEKNTITDANWTFEVTKVSGIELTVKAHSDSFIGTEPAAIDFSEVKGTDGKSYDVVEFKNGVSRSGFLAAKNQKDRVTAFIAPKCGKISGDYAFDGCKNLTQVRLDTSKAVTIAAACFGSCENIEVFEPRILANAPGAWTFDNCSKLTGGIEIKGTGTIGQNAFSNSAFEWVKGLDTASINDKAFSGCTSLKSVNFPKVTKIPYQAFLSCSSLEEVLFPAVTEIVHQSFSNCVRLDADDLNALLGPQLIKLGQIKNGNFYGDCFNGCTGIKGTIVWDLPNLATNAVPPNFFNGCSGISRVEFKTPVCDIGGNAFAGISPGAEIYLGRSQIKVFGREAIGTATTPYPKIFVRNFDEGLISAMEKTNITLREKDFRNTSWVSPLGSAYTHGWTATWMYKDNTVCEKITIDKVSYPSPIINRVHAFVAWGRFAWVIGEPKGFSVKIQ